MAENKNHLPAHERSESLSVVSLCDPMDCSPPGSSVHEVFQGRILEWVAISSSRVSSQLRDRTCVSCIDRWILYHRATWEAQFSLYRSLKLSTFVFSQRSWYVKSKERRYESWFYPNSLSFLPLGESFINSFVFWGKNSRVRIFGGVGVCILSPPLLMGQLCM